MAITVPKQKSFSVASAVGVLEIAIGIGLLGYGVYFLYHYFAIPKQDWEGWNGVFGILFSVSGLTITIAGIGVVWLRKYWFLFHIPLAVMIVFIWQEGP